MALHHNNTARTDVILPPVLFHIVPDHRIVGHDNTFIQNRPADSGALADVTVIKNDRVLNKCAVVHAHASAQYRIADQSA